MLEDRGFDREVRAVLQFVILGEAALFNQSVDELTARSTEVRTLLRGTEGSSAMDADFFREGVNRHGTESAAWSVRTLRGDWLSPAESCLNDSSRLGR